MSLEAGALLGMAIGMVGMLALGGFAIWSKYAEDREEKKERGNGLKADAVPAFSTVAHAAGCPYLIS